MKTIRNLSPKIFCIALLVSLAACASDTDETNPDLSAWVPNAGDEVRINDLDRTQETNLCNAVEAFIIRDRDEATLTSALCLLEVLDPEATEESKSLCAVEHENCIADTKRAVDLGCDRINEPETGLGITTCNPAVTLGDMEQCVAGLARFFGRAADEVLDKVSCSLASDETKKRQVIDALLIEQDRDLSAIEGCAVVAAACPDFLGQEWH